MLSSSPSETQQLTSQSTNQSAPTGSSDSSAKSLDTLVSLSAAALCVSFFLPWINFLGASLNGVSIQKNFESYRMIWLIPILAGVAFVLNVAGQKSAIVRRIAGLCPFAVLVYALNNVGGQLFEAMECGAWIALAAGALLISIPNKAK